MLGRDFSSLRPEEVQLNNAILYDINMGYAVPTSLRPHQSIKYHRMESSFIHPWSFDAVGEQWGVNKLHEFIPLRDYLELPANSVDQILAGVIRGRGKRKKMDDDARKAHEEEMKRKGQELPANATPWGSVEDVMRQLQGEQP